MELAAETSSVPSDSGGSMGTDNSSSHSSDSSESNSSPESTAGKDATDDDGDSNRLGWTTTASLQVGHYTFVAICRELHFTCAPITFGVISTSI